MVKENIIIIIPKENYKKVEEVRELENKDLEQKKDESKVIKKLEETILPTVHASDYDEKEKEKEEGTKQAIGTGLATTTAVNPLLGGIAEGVSFGLGSATEGIGKMTDNEGLKIVGRTFKDAPTQPFKGSKK